MGVAFPPASFHCDVTNITKIKYNYNLINIKVSLVEI